AVAERALLARQVLHPVSVALVPAHGSPRASSAEFIATVRPSWALVAAAHLNRFDYPRPEVLARWREAGAQVRQVSQEGAITLSVEPRGPAELPPGERIRHRRYWTVD
ncbi:MAG: DNA internalization-related competence protein ComEC/Rec2, partial [Proteobacteria bacterium]|nr:DNA internalization-related competence protein ComEC/Rec2 [Pseudomonadota bacterium]